MNLTYKSSPYCEFLITGLIHQWEQQTKYRGKSALEIASENNIPMPIFWKHYKYWKAIKRI